MSKLETIEGIGPVMSKKLRDAGVRSTDGLLRAGATRAGRRQISETAGIDEGRLLKFVNHSDLMRVRGVGGEYAELLEAAGVDTVPELAGRNPTNLVARMSHVNDEKKLVRLVPAETRIADWVRQAKGMTRMVSH